jgi:hypothetical protein
MNNPSIILELTLSVFKLLIFVFTVMYQQCENKLNVLKQCYRAVVGLYFGGWNFLFSCVVHLVLGIGIPLTLAQLLNDMGSNDLMVER